MDPKQWFRKNPDRVVAWVAIGLGAVVLYLGWDGASSTAYPAEQLPYILSGGIGGSLLVALGATLLISADLRDEWRKLDRIERRLSPTEAEAEAQAGTEGQAEVDDVVEPTTEAGSSGAEPPGRDATPSDGVLATSGNGRRPRTAKLAPKRAGS
jgi:hypothetical protein